MQINEQEPLRERKRQEVSSKEKLLLLTHEADIPGRSQTRDNDDANTVKQSKIDKRSMEKRYGEAKDE